MKCINTLTYINRFVFGTTLVLYVTIFLGLYAQVVLGFTQILSALTLLFFVKKFSLKNQNKLLFYWGFVIVYGLFWLEDSFNRSNTLSIMMLIIFPLSIAGYFTFILESLKKNQI